ncbi:PREDICTED: non-homologous end-joining factor 1-like [Polistes canadensis]|uniref:non-homologous end-joining factor 1-like n=1 Tax=Polistes canadensis TaxID=91411 RepID=UPI000718D9A3|nr:PREDICTED: non-homologous end-joining factor 1-like [Polistes canadensis]XP_014605470.1 PREDICTED: non-homologous end-joining factor 1-like [Polistes canadensis]
MAVNLLNQNDLGKVWKEIIIDNESFIICVTKEHNAWKILLSNFKEIWSECLTDEKILNRSKELNSMLIIDDSELMEVVLDTLTNIPKYVDKPSKDHIKLLKNFEGGGFKFEINLSKGTTEEYWDNITRPLCLSSVELIRRQNILLDLIKKKDQEIAEYKAEGAELIRKNIETEVFNENQLNTHSIKIDESNYADPFQKVIEFYNKTIFKNDVKIEGNSVGLKNPIKQERQSISDIPQSSGCNITILKEETDNELGKSSFQSGNSSKSKRGKRNKISNMNIVPIVIPSKRNKNSITDNIL